MQRVETMPHFGEAMMDGLRESLTAMGAGPWREWRATFEAPAQLAREVMREFEQTTPEARAEFLAGMHAAGIHGLFALRCEGKPCPDWPESAAGWSLSTETIRVAGRWVVFSITIHNAETARAG